MKRSVPICSVSDEQRKKVQLLELRILEEVDRLCRKHEIPYTLAYGTLLGCVRHKGFIPWDDDIDICMMRDDVVRFKEICRKELHQNFFYQTHDTDPEYFYLMDKIRLNGTVFKESFVSRYNIHHGVYIDIFPIDRLPNSRILKFLQFSCFHLFRTGLQSKYLMTGARNGWKGVAARILKIVYSPFSLSFLYRFSHKIAMAFNNKSGFRELGCFFSPYKSNDVYPAAIFKHFRDMPFEGLQAMCIGGWDYMLKKLYGDYMKLPPENQRKTRHTLSELNV